jgi:hypothetical protein
MSADSRGGSWQGGRERGEEWAALTCVRSGHSAKVNFANKRRICIVGKFFFHFSFTCKELSTLKLSNSVQQITKISHETIYVLLPLQKVCSQITIRPPL